MDEAITYQDYTIKKTTVANYADLAKLYQQVYKKELAANFFTNKYNHYDTSLPVVISFIATTTDGQIIALASILPISVLYQQHSFIVGQWADAIVHPQHQQKGLSLVLCTKCIEDAKTVGLLGVFCLPVDTTFNLVTKKLQHQFTSLMYCYKIKINTFPLARLSHRLNFDSIHTALFLKFISKFNISNFAYNHTDNATNIVVDHNEKLFYYKKNLGSIYLKIEGTFVWLKFKKGVLYIGDITPTTEDELKNVLTALKKICFYSGIQSIIFQSTKNGFVESYLREHYITTPSYKICTLSFKDDFPMEKIDLIYGDADNF